MSMRIGGPSGIRRSGTTIENEPIIKSDGAGEMMQWQPSDGGADGIYITESVEDGPTFIGVGVAIPKAPIHVKMGGTNWEDSLLLEKSSGNTGWNFLPGNSGNITCPSAKLPRTQRELPPEHVKRCTCQPPSAELPREPC